MRMNFPVARAHTSVFAALIVVLLVAPIASAGVPSQGSVGITPSAVVLAGSTDVNLLQSDSEGIVLRVGAPNHTVTTGSSEGTACQTVEAPGYVLSEEAGRPQLPYKVVLLGVPPGADVQVTAETTATERIAAGLQPCAAPKVSLQLDAEGLAQDVIEEPALDAAIYNADRLYPAEIARVVDLGFMRSQRVVRLEVTPVQVNPVTGERLFHKEIRVSLRFRGVEGSAASVAGSAGLSPAAEPAEFESAFQKHAAELRLGAGLAELGCRGGLFGRRLDAARPRLQGCGERGWSLRTHVQRPQRRGPAGRYAGHIHLAPVRRRPGGRHQRFGWR